jgi:hypothetical protein
VGFWDDKSNRRWYLSWLVEQLDFKTVEQWESLTADQLRAHRGNSLIAKWSVKQMQVEGASI